MLDYITKSVSKIFGSKSERDIKEIQPIVEKIHEASSSIITLSNDALRAKTSELKKRIADHITEEGNKIAEIRSKIESDTTLEVDAKEKLYEEIDELEKNITKKIQIILDDVLPEAFAIVKETAKRFKENSAIEVTATQMDKNLAASRDSVQIQNDKALWHNNWIAAGTKITWDMVH